MKKIALTILISFVLLLFGCQNKEIENNEEEVEKKPLACYVGLMQKRQQWGKQ